MPGARGLLIAAVVLAALAGGVWYSNKLETEKEGKAPADASPKLLEIAEDQFQKIEISKAGTDPVVLERDGADWKMTAPQALPVDRDAVTSVVSTLSSYTTERLVEEKAADLAAFGLVQPQLTVTVTKKDGRAEKLLIGDEAPTGGGFFARKDGDPRVFTVFSYNRATLDKSWGDLRDRRLLPFETSKVTRVELADKGRVIELGKTAGGDWQILKPGPYRADNVAVDAIIQKLGDAKMEAGAPEPDAAKLWSTGTPVVVARVFDAGGGKQIQIRKSKDAYYARSDVVEGAFRIGPGIEGVAKTVDELRTKKLFDFGFNDPSKLAIQQEGSVVELTRNGEDWQRGGKKLESSGVSQLIDKLREFSSIKFLTSGFATPEISISVVSEDGKRTEKVDISKSGYSWIAKRAGEPALYELDGKAVEELQQAVRDLKEASPAPAKK